MAVISYHDDDDFEERGKRDFARLVLEVGAIREALGWIAPEPGSLLEGDDTATPADRLSWQANGLLTVALDHLETLVDAVEGSEALRVVGPYPLIRASLEASALGLWLLSGGTRDKRVLRSVRLVANHLAKTEDLVSKLGGEARDLFDETRAELVAAKDARRSLRMRDLDAMSDMTEILMLIEPIVDADGLSPLIAWSSCASLSHANRIATVVVAQALSLPREPQRDHERWIAGSWGMTSMFMSTAVASIRRLEEMLRKHARAT